MTQPIAPSHIPAHATPGGDGVIVGDGPVRADAFIDFQCPFCDIGRATGLAEPFTMCLAEGPYLDWPPYVTARATALGVEATPTVWVDGEPVRPEAPMITAAVTAAAARL